MYINNAFLGVLCSFGDRGVLWIREGNSPNSYFLTEIASKINSLQAGLQSRSGKGLLPGYCGQSLLCWRLGAFCTE